MCNPNKWQQKNLNRQSVCEGRVRGKRLLLGLKKIYILDSMFLYNIYNIVRRHELRRVERSAQIVPDERTYLLLKEGNSKRNRYCCKYSFVSIKFTTVFSFQVWKNFFQWINIVDTWYNIHIIVFLVAYH